MTRNKAILITGANGEVGHGLIDHLYGLADMPDIITLDLRPLDASLQDKVVKHYSGNILDDVLIGQIEHDYAIDTIYHLAALLSTSAERNPLLAHEVNVNGTVKLLELATRASQTNAQSVKFIYPSSIAVYGLPDVTTKMQADAIHEDQYLNPITMYGVNKLYVEHLGRYYSQHYGLLSENTVDIDFRGVRFPGLISAHTVPSGGTSDYGPEMIHAVAQGKPYTCFVREDTTLPFMTMPDAIHALVTLAQAPRESLTRHIYNVTSFSLSASDFANIVKSEFGETNITFNPNTARQSIVDTWSAILDDSTAREDWGWSPLYTQDEAFTDYVFKHICETYNVRELSMNPNC